MTWIDWIYRMLLGAITHPAGGVGVVAPIGSSYSVEAEELRKRAAIVAFCRAQLGEPYVYGTEHPLGEPADDWDCSELSHHAYNDIPMEMPDGARFQFNFCQAVPFGLAGDLHFLWSDKLGCIGHVMVDTGEGTVIHAVSGRGVVEDPLGRWAGHARYRGCRRHIEIKISEHELRLQKLEDMGDILHQIAAAVGAGKPSPRSRRGGR